MGKVLRNLTAVCALGAMTACTSVYRNHGYTPTESELNTIVTGVDTRETVIEQLGNPTAEGVTRSSGLYYVSSRWRHFGAMRPRPIEREVVAVTFDDSGVVRNIARYGLEDGRVIALNRRVTNPPNEISFIRQLLGNVGRITAEDLIGDG